MSVCLSFCIFVCLPSREDNRCVAGPDTCADMPVHYVSSHIYLHAHTWMHLNMSICTPQICAILGSVRHSWCIWCRIRVQVRVPVWQAIGWLVENRSSCRLLDVTWRDFVRTTDRCLCTYVWISIYTNIVYVCMYKYIFIHPHTHAHTHTHTHTHDIHVCYMHIHT